MGLGTSTKTVGGGAAAPVASDFGSFLQSLLQPAGMQTTGGTALARSNPVGQTGDLASAFHQLLSGGAGVAGGINDILQQQKTTDIANLRERYSMGGTGYGTPAATAESRYLGTFTPQAAVQVGQAQNENIARALGLIMPAFQQAFGLGTPQAQTIQQKGFGGQLLSGITGLAGAAAPFFGAGGIFGAGGNGIPAAPDISSLGNMMPQSIPNYNPLVLNPIHWG